MLVCISHDDWVDPKDVSALDSLKEADGVRVTVVLKNGAKLIYSKQASGKAREMARIVNDALEQLKEQEGPK